MKVSINWLSDFVKLDISPEILADRLTMAGLEVEGCAGMGGEFEGIITGRVLSVLSHPDAEKLSLCEVDVGSEAVPIVCGATNVRSGQHVPVALPGTLLPNGVRIEKVEIRGEPSVGMLCSELELGLGEDGSGIMVLPQHCRPGQAISVGLELEDWILDISITPNRGDCLSIWGIAREVAAVLHCPLQPMMVRVQEEGPPILSLTSVQIEEPELCGRYAARVVLRTNVRPSPLWMRWRLKGAGIRSISNVVDVTNYVMMERGQPLHAFDYDQLKGRRIIVRRAREGEGIISLDGVSRALSPEMLVIADAHDTVAIAGVMGGADSEVCAQTHAILLESAWFDPTSIRRTSKVLGLPSEASYRFERRVDPEGTVIAIDRAAQLILETGGGEVAEGVCDVYPRPYSSPSVSLRTRRAQQILGAALSRKKIVAIMKRLQFPTLSQDRNAIQVSVPSFRGDIHQEIDLIEEIARIEGYDHIPRALPRGEICPQEASSGSVVEGVIRRLLSASGFFEVINFSFTRPEVFDKLQFKEDDPLRRAVRLRNPLSEEYSILRTHLLSSLLENLRWNINRNIRDLKIFEIAKTYHLMDAQVLPQERREVVVLSIGRRVSPHWGEDKGEIDFFYLKGVVEALGRALGLEMEFCPIDLSFLHPGESAGITAEGHGLGWIGRIHPEVMEGFDLMGASFGFGLTDLDRLSSFCHDRKRHTALPRFPAVVRDVALMVPIDLSSREPHELIRKTGGDLVDEVRLFDLFQGGNIPAGRKSLAFSIYYRSGDRTLTDEEVNEIHASLIEVLKRELGAEIR